MKLPIGTKVRILSDFWGHKNFIGTITQYGGLFPYFILPEGAEADWPYAENEIAPIDRNGQLLFDFMYD